MLIEVLRNVHVYSDKVIIAGVLLAKNEKILILANRMSIMGVYYL